MYFYYSWILLLCRLFFLFESEFIFLLWSRFRLFLCNSFSFLLLIIFGLVFFILKLLCSFLLLTLTSVCIFWSLSIGKRSKPFSELKIFLGLVNHSALRVPYTGAKNTKTRINGLIILKRFSIYFFRREKHLIRKLNF